MFCSRSLCEPNSLQHETVGFISWDRKKKKESSSLKCADPVVCANVQPLQRAVSCIPCLVSVCGNEKAVWPQVSFMECQYGERGRGAQPDNEGAVKSLEALQHSDMLRGSCAVMVWLWICPLLCLFFYCNKMGKQLLHKQLFWSYILHYIIYYIILYYIIITVYSVDLHKQLYWAVKIVCLQGTFLCQIDLRCIFLPWKRPVFLGSPGYTRVMKAQGNEGPG